MYIVYTCIGCVDAQQRTYAFVCFSDFFCACFLPENVSICIPLATAFVQISLFSYYDGISDCISDMVFGIVNKVHYCILGVSCPWSYGVGWSGWMNGWTVG